MAHIIQREILDFIKDNDITEFSDILEIAMDAGYEDWINILMNFSTLSISTYIRSRRHKLKGGDE